jgi:hypothetical protein
VAANDFVLGDPIGSTNGDFVLGPPVDQAPRQEEQARYGVAMKVQDAIAKERAAIDPYEPPGARAFGTAFGKRVSDFGLGLLPSLANMTTAPFRNAGNAVGYLFGSPAIGSAIQPEISGPTTNQVTSAYQALSPQGFDPQKYRQAQAEADIADYAREKVHPNSTLAGKFAGDIASIVALRNPLAPEIVAATKSPDALLAANRAAGAGASQVAAFWNSAGMQGLRRAAGKAGETGLEQYLLTQIHGGDPIHNAAIAGGLQLGGSLAMFPVFRFPTAAATLAALATTATTIQMWKDVIPGGRDFLLNSAESAIKAYGLSTIGAITAGMLGAGRFAGSGPAWRSIQGMAAPLLRHDFARRLPQVADAVNTTLRSGANSIITMMQNDDNSKSPVIGPIFDKLSQDTSQFTPAELDKMGKGVLKGTLRQTLLEMLKDQTPNTNGQTFAQRMGM